MPGPSLNDFLKQNVTLFREFDDARISQLVEGSRQLTVEPNEAVIEFGEEGRFLGVMIDGTAEVSVVDDGGKRHKLSELKTGDIFGEMSLLTGDKTVADVIGITRCTVLLVPEQLFSRVCITFPPAIKYLSRLLT